MRRILLVLAIAALMVSMLAGYGAPLAFAEANPNSSSIGEEVTGLNSAFGEGAGGQHIGSLAIKEGGLACGEFGPSCTGGP